MADRSRAIRLPDGSTGLFVPADDCGWLWTLIRRATRSYIAESGSRGGRRIADLGFAAASVATGDVDVDELLDLSTSEPEAVSPRRQIPTTTDLEESGWLSTDEAAHRLACTRRTVQRRAARGELQGARRVGRDWVVPAAAVDGRRRP